MDVSSVTVGLPVADLRVAVEWYRRVLQLPAPDLEPAEGVVEFRVGTVWLQLSEEPIARSGAEVVLGLGVTDAALERERLAAMGLEVGPLVHVEGAVDYVDLADPDGNRLNLYSMAPQDPPT
ncbi:VOC family protein [Cellulomonas shaoxiangyii]|uniref:VOC family protein n=1 Tax=Cellulomonas shaoxiangyii TaxID=2566013 RepID=A0A4V1CMW9_9CELL|nr:VOC family protein [Cellulomonas shaoxiangyii]QCB94405.1 VOC family protein [Cellulomonas shaoxiangyii]TGY80174.1 VOC family protein [Cellulomonas shaoxiangyii]